METATEFQEISSCDNCQATVSETEKFCTTCGYPVRGTQADKASYSVKVAQRLRMLKEAESKVKRARNILYFLAAITFVVGLVMAFISNSVADGVVYLILSPFYLIMIVWSSKNAFGAILTSMIVFVTLQILSAVVDPITIFQGIIFKVIFIIAFVRGIQSASDAQRIVKELEQFNVKPVGAN